LAPLNFKNSLRPRPRSGNGMTHPACVKGSRNFWRRPLTRPRRLHLPPKRQMIDLANLTPKRSKSYSLERRWSSHRFPYGYLVTTSSQSPPTPSAPASLAG